MKQKLLLKAMLLLCALVAGSSSVWAEEVVHYTLDGTATGGTNGYATESDITQNGISWKVTGNTTQNPWRIGGKDLDGVDRTAYSTTAMGSATTKVELEIGTTSLTINSITLVIASNSDFSTVLQTIEKTSVSASSTLTFSPSGENWAKDAYYKFIFNVTNTTSNTNQYVQMKSAKFYKEVTLTDPTITFNDGSVRVGKTLDVSTLFTSNSTGAVTYSITAGGSYATLDGSTLTAGASVGSVTVQASQVAKDEYNAKTATATISVVDPALSSIAITTAPTKTTYDEGDLFDKTGMVVTATFADASTENVTASCTWSPDGALSTSDTEVTISYTYKGVNKTATQAITVKAYVQPTSVSVTNWNTLFGTSFTGSLSGTDLKTYSGITNRVTIEYAKGSGNNMYMKNTEIRLYSGNTLSFTAPTGYCIKQIEFSGTIDDGKKPTVDVGTYNNSTKKWTGAATTVIFTGTATSANISSVTITLSTTVPVTIASSCYSTLATSCGLDFANATPSGLEAYVVPSVTASAVSLSAVNEAPASTGVILKGTASTEYTIPVKVGAASVGTNKLHAAEKATTLADGSFYILKSGLFCLVTGAADAAARTVPAGKAYLLKSDVPASAPGYLGFDFGSTNISTTNFTNDTNNSGEFYNLAGQRVANPTKGLYIVNGRKVVIK